MPKPFHSLLTGKGAGFCTFPLHKSCSDSLWGGGRAAAFPTLQSGDISLNIAHAAQPHVLGDIAAVPFQQGQWRTVFFERVPFLVLTR
jgi:hypothetical protein